LWGKKSLIFPLSFSLFSFLPTKALFSLLCGSSSPTRSQRFRPRLGAAARRPAVVGGAAAAVNTLFLLLFALSLLLPSLYTFLTLKFSTPSPKHLDLKRKFEKKKITFIPFMSLDGLVLMSVGFAKTGVGGSAACGGNTLLNGCLLVVSAGTVNWFGRRLWFVQSDLVFESAVMCCWRGWDLWIWFRVFWIAPEFLRCCDVLFCRFLVNFSGPFLSVLVISGIGMNLFLFLCVCNEDLEWDRIGRTRDSLDLDRHDFGRYLDKSK